jgi:prepilin-type N-terminal cleavage/methylation domain-containing protein
MRQRWASSGFTIVELLIVIVVIAILAAVTVAGYQGIQQNAKSSVVNDAVQSWESAVLRLAIEGGVPPAEPTCLGSPGDFPATSTFPQNVCVLVDGNPTVSYDNALFTTWPAIATRPKGLLPETSFNGQGLSVKARGVWLFSTNPSTKSVTLAWVPQISEKCGSGVSALSGDTPLGGGYCWKNVYY